MLQDIRDSLQGHKWLTFWSGPPRRHARILGRVLRIDFTGVSSAADMAKVNGEKISREYANRRWSESSRAGRGSWAPHRTSSVRSSSRTAGQLRLMATRPAWKTGFRVCQAITSRGRAEPSFQVEDGKFSRRGASRVGADGMTESAYFNDTRRSLLINSAAGRDGRVGLPHRRKLKRLSALLDEEREVRYVMLEPDHSPAPPRSTMRPSRRTTTRMAIAS